MKEAIKAGDAVEAWNQADAVKTIPTVGITINAGIIIMKTIIAFSYH